MTSMFDSMVRARREHTPWAHISLTSLMKELAEEGDQGVTLTCAYDYKQVTRCWWTFTWTDEAGQKHSVGSQQYDLCLWRAAETVMQQRERAKQQEQPSDYNATDVVGHWITLIYYEPEQQSLVICSDCWERQRATTLTHMHRKRDITFAETAEGELVCSYCHLQLPTRGEP